MAISKKATHVVTHPKLRLMVGGKMERIPLGKQIALSTKIGDRLIEKGFVKSISDEKTLEVGGKPTKEQIADAKKVLEAADAEAKKLADEKAKAEADAKAKAEADAKK